MQSDAGRAMLSKYALPEGQLYSVMFIYNNTVYDKSRAALEIARRLNGLWPSMYVFIVVPPFIRDFVYDWISRNRYRWFGVRNECMLPTPEMKERFI